MSSLRDQLKVALARVDKEIKASITLAAKGVAQGMVEQSTIDTGLFAANWRTGVNGNNNSDLTFAYFGVDDLSLEYPNNREISEAEALEVAQDIHPFKLGDELTWTNSVPYLKDASGGFSPTGDSVLGLERGKDIAKALVAGGL